MKLVAAILARNEAGPDRYLERVITRCREFSDTVVLLDDNSTDRTPQIAERMGCVVRTRSATDHAWGKEASARKELWEFASEYATDANSWILVNDADQILVGDIRGLCQTREANTLCFTLYDLWSETEYREDEFWRGHLNHRPWAFSPHRVPDGWVPEWNTAQIHTGHSPINFPMVPLIAPPDAYYWKHYSYARPEHRQAKYAQYMAQANQLNPAQYAHAQSILA